MAFGHVTSVVADAQTPPAVEELETLFSRLVDTDLLAALQGPTRRGPKGRSAAGAENASGAGPCG